MSRIGHKPISLPKGVNVTIESGTVEIQGPKGKLRQSLPPGIFFEKHDGQIVAKPVRDDQALSKFHGLARSLVANAVKGVTEGFRKELDIVGIGYRAEVKGRQVVFALGYSHSIVFEIPPGIDISVEMLQKARERARELRLTDVTLGVMDASNLEYPTDTFDHVLATYVISAVPDPVKTLLEMRRVCQPGGHIVILNHFRSENPVLGALEWMVAPVCTRIGFKTDLKLNPLMERARMSPDQVHRINVMRINGWRLVRCVKSG